MTESIFIVIIVFASILTSRFAQLHTDLEAAHNDLLVIDKLKDDFLATTTHELRTPLHGILGITENLAGGTLGSLNDEQKRNLELIRNSAERLNGLVSSILDFSKIRAGKVDLLIEELSLADLISSVMSLLRQTAHEKGLVFITEFDQLPRIKADRNRIYQVLVNLIGNAIKFTDRGSITVRASRPDADFVRVEIRDTGVGIDRGDLERIWKPFVQAEDPDTRRANGSGLGLAITRQLVEMHGGRIRVASAKGTGSTFTLELPVETAAPSIMKARATERVEPSARTVSVMPVAARAREEQKAEPPMQTKYPAAAILAIDDDPISMKVLQNVCSSAGYTLLSAATGPEALAIIADNKIDLVLLDLMLPGMSGFEVCQRIRKMESGRYVPVIILTARDHLGDLVQGFETGANDYVTKPFRRQELLLRIENQLAIKQLLDMESSVISGLKREKEDIASLFHRSQEIKESTLQMLEWENIIKEDLNIAHAFQMKFMTHADNVPGVESSIQYHPLLDVGGDLYDIFELRPGVLRIFMADATGHGITASLNTVKILSEYAAFKETLGTPAQMMNFLNKRFSTSLSNYMIIFTCLIADIDLNASRVAISSSGLPDQYLLNSTNVTNIESMNPILGLTETIIYTEKTFDFNKGDILFIYTDGLDEVIYPHTAMEIFDEENRKDVLAEKLITVYNGKSMDEAGKELFDHFCKGKKINDDVTFLAIRKTV